MQRRGLGIIGDKGRPRPGGQRHHQQKASQQSSEMAQGKFYHRRFLYNIMEANSKGGGIALPALCCVQGRVQAQWLNI